MAEAVSDIPDGATVMIGGFGASGSPIELIHALIDRGTTDLVVINNNTGKTVLAEMFKNGGKPELIVKEKNLAQVSDEGFIQETIDKVLADNPSELEKFLAGKEALFQWFVGQVARATKGKADMNVAKELLVKALEERKK